MISEIPSQCPIYIIISRAFESQRSCLLYFFLEITIFSHSIHRFLKFHSVVTFLKKNIGYINVSAILWIGYEQLTYNKIIANLNV